MNETCPSFESRQIDFHQQGGCPKGVLNTDEARMCVSIAVANIGKTGFCVNCKAYAFILFLFKSRLSQLESVNIRLETVLAPCLCSSLGST